MVTMDFNSDSSDGGVEITSYEKPFDQRTPIGLSTDSGGGGGGGADGDTDDDDVIVQRYSSTTSITAATSSYIPAAYRTEDTCKKKYRDHSSDSRKHKRDRGHRRSRSRGHRRRRSHSRGHRRSHSRGHRRSRSRCRRRSRSKGRRTSRSRVHRRSKERRDRSREHHRRRNGHHKTSDKSRKYREYVDNPEVREHSPDTNRRNRRQRNMVGGCVFGGGASTHVLNIKKIKIKKEKLDPVEELRRLNAMITEPFVYKPIDIEIRQEPVSDDEMDLGQ